MKDNDYILNITSSESLNALQTSVRISNAFFLYKFLYKIGVKMEANEKLVFKNDPLPEIAAVYALTVAALQKKIAIKGKLIQLKMDSMIDYKNGKANLCIETLQCILFDDLTDKKESEICLDQLRVYPSLRLDKSMEGLQSCYKKSSNKITNKIENIFKNYSIKIPKLNKNYDCMNPQNVVDWLEDILIINSISPKYIALSLKSMSAISDLPVEDQKIWLDQCLKAYKQRFVNKDLKKLKNIEKEICSQQERQVKKERDIISQDINIVDNNAFIQNDSLEQKEIQARNQLKALYQEIEQRNKNKKVSLEIKQRVYL